MDCSPASMRITANPMYFQLMMNIRVPIATDGSAIHDCAAPSSPIFSSIELRAPVSRSMSDHPVPTTTSLITYGTKMSTRIRLRPRMR